MEIGLDRAVIVYCVGLLALIGFKRLKGDELPHNESIAFIFKCSFV